MAERASVVLIDDQPSIRLLVRTALEVEPDFAVIGEAHDLAEGIETARRLRPDAVVVDLSGRSEDVPSPAVAIKHASPKSIVVVFSARSPAQLEPAHISGADARVQKGGSLEELITALRGALGVTMAERDEVDSLAAVVAHGMLGTLTVIRAAGSALASNWDRLSASQQLELMGILAMQTEQLRDAVSALPPVIGRRLIDELGGLLQVVGGLQIGQLPSHRDRVALFENTEWALPRIAEILKGVIAGLPPDVIAELDRLRQEHS